MQCKQCQQDFEPKHFNEKLCSSGCKWKAKRERQERYKKTEKGKVSNERWVKSDRRFKNEQRYRQKPKARKLAVERNRRYLENNPKARQRKKVRDSLYMSRTQGKLRGWWKEESAKGCNTCGSIRNLTLDHVISLAEGGATHDKENLQVLCKKCNSHKHNKRQNAVDVERILRLQGKI